MEFGQDSLVSMLFGGLIVYFFLSSSFKKEKTESEDTTEVLESKIREILDNKFRGSRDDIDSKFGESKKQIDAQFRGNREEQRSIHNQEKTIIEDKFKELSADMKERGEDIDAKMKEIKNQVDSFSDLSKNVQSLLSTAQSRGSLGEEYLEALLEDHLGPPGQDEKGGLFWDRQYQFKDGTAADIVIKSPNSKMLVIDSKFPMENFIKYKDSKNDPEKDLYKKNFIKDMKNHINKVSQYRKPEEGTYENTVMFLPAKGLFEMARFEGSIEKHARKKNVSLCGPGNVFLFLTVVLDNVKMDIIKENLDEVMRKMAILSRKAGDIKEAARLAIKNNKTHSGHLENIERQAGLFQDEYEKISNNVKELPDSKEDN